MQGQSDQNDGQPFHYYAKVGATSDASARVVRIVHVSDTHMKHSSFTPSLIPPGDILIHSGDFVNIWPSLAVSDEDIEGSGLEDLCEINRFFSSQPHKHKVFVCGNHEYAINSLPQDKIQAALSPYCYLQDSGVTLEGIHIYGSPWNTSYGSGFSERSELIGVHWNKIPQETDILVTHMPPLGIMDKGRSGRLSAGWCSLCQAKGDTETHHGRCHWGCAKLLDTIVNRVRPKAHLFGHVHEDNGVEWLGDILFSNGALDHDGDPVVIDYFVAQTAPLATVKESHKKKSKCAIH